MIKLYNQLNTGYLPQDYVSSNSWDILAFVGVIALAVTFVYLIKLVIQEIVSWFVGNKE